MVIGGGPRPPPIVSLADQWLGWGATGSRYHAPRWCPRAPLCCVWPPRAAALSHGLTRLDRTAPMAIPSGRFMVSGVQVRRLYAARRLLIIALIVTIDRGFTVANRRVDLLPR
jgi:hypothetical protein